MNKKPKQQTRREFLHAIGGTATVYQAMISMGLLVPGDARAAINRERWKQNSQQSLTRPQTHYCSTGRWHLWTVCSLGVKKGRLFIFCY